MYILYISFILAPQGSSSNITKAGNRDDIVSIPLSEIPIQLLGRKKNGVPTAQTVEITGTKKTNVVTILDPKTPKEHLASMVLINPKPELNLDLTKQEVNEINNRREHNNKDDRPSESLSEALAKYKQLLKDTDDRTVTRKTPIGDDGNATDTGTVGGSHTSGGETQSNEMSPGEATPDVEKPTKELSAADVVSPIEPTPSSSNKISSKGVDEGPVAAADVDTGGTAIPEKELLSSSSNESPVKEIASTYNPKTKENKEFTTSPDEYYENTDTKYSPSEDGEHDKGAKLSGNLDNFKAGVTPDIPLEFNPSKENDKEDKKAESLPQKQKQKQKQKEKLLKQYKEEKPAKVKKGGKQFKLENSKFKPKFIPVTKSSSPNEKQDIEDGEITKDREDGELKKITDETTSERPGALSQTVEFHSGNGKEHVSEHPQQAVDYDKMFFGKIQEKVKNGKNGFFNQKIMPGKPLSSPSSSSSSKENGHLRQTQTLITQNDQGFLPEDLGLTPIRDQYESVSELDDHQSSSSSSSSVEEHLKTAKAVTKMNIPKQQNHKIINLLGAIEQVAKQTASMAQNELRRIDQGQQGDLPVASKRILEVKSKKINVLLNSLNGEEDKDKLGMETRQLQNVIRTLGDVFSQIPAKKKALTAQRKSSMKNTITIDGYQIPYISEIADNPKSDKKKSLLDFHPIKIVKSKITSNGAGRHGNKTNNAKDHKIRSFLKAFEEHLEDITSFKKSSLNKAKLSKAKKQAWQKPTSKQHIELNHLYRAKAADNVTSFPFQLPFATAHSPNPILPSPVVDSDINIPHLVSQQGQLGYTRWSADEDYHSNHLPFNPIHENNARIDRVLLNPEPIIGPSRSNVEDPDQEPPITAMGNQQQPYATYVPGSSQSRQDIPDIAYTGDGDNQQVMGGDNRYDDEEPYNHNQVMSDVEQTFEEQPEGLPTLPDNSVVKQAHAFDDISPVVNDISDPVPSNMNVPAVVGSVGGVAGGVGVLAKNPVLSVSLSGKVAESHDETIDKGVEKPSPAKPEVGRFSHLNLNTLSRKNQAPQRYMPTPKPPGLPNIKPMEQFATFNHGLKPLRARINMKKRPLMKDRKSKDSTRLIKHVKKKNNIKHAAPKVQPNHPPSKKTKIKKKPIKETHIISLSSKPKHFTKTEKGTAKQDIPTVSSAAKKSIDYNQPLSIFARGRSIHFKTPPAISKALMSGIVEKKAKINKKSPSLSADFPMVVSVANFTLDELPLLTKGRSYVLTSSGEKGMLLKKL